MQKFIEKSISHVYKLFPEIYANRSKRGSYHFSLALERSKIIAVGVNRPEREDSRAFKFAQKLGLADKLLYSYLHAEEAMIGRLIGLDKLDSSLKIVVLRLNKWGQLGNSCPCLNCKTVLSAYGLNRIWYSTENGEIKELS